VSNKIEVVDAEELEEETAFPDLHNQLQDMGRRGCKGAIVIGFFDPRDGHEFASAGLEDASMFEITGFMDLMKLRIQLGHLDSSGDDE
jgi:hypothetical protein